MRINTRIVFDWDGVVLERESFEYSGPLALCDRKTSGAIAQQGIDTSKQNQQNAQTSFNNTNKTLSDYSSNLNQFLDYGRSTYGKSGEFAADQNTLSTGAAAAGTKSVAGDLAMNKLRTGANSASYAPTLATAKSNAEQNLTQQLAGADASRLGQLTAINQYGVSASALPAQIQAQLYGTSLSGANSALGVGQSASAADQSFGDVFGQSLASSLGKEIGSGGGGAKGA
jgi:hypothetical protein